MESVTTLPSPKLISVARFAGLAVKMEQAKFYDHPRAAVQLRTLLNHQGNSHRQSPPKNPVTGQITDSYRHIQRF